MAKGLIIALLLSLWLNRAIGAESNSSCDPILSPITNDYTDFWVAKLDRSIHLNFIYLPSGLSREQLNTILGVPIQTIDRWHLKALREMNHRDELEPNPASPYSMLQKARDYVSHYSPADLNGRSLSEVRFSLMRDLFNRISQLSNWQAFDYSVEDIEGRHFVFVGRGVVNVIVIRAQTGELVSGVRDALKSHLVPDKTFFRAPLQAR